MMTSKIRILPTMLAIALCAGPLPAQTPVDSALAAFIAGIRAVDNHAHPNSVAPADSEYDALPLDGIPTSPWPMRIRPENPEWIAAYRAVYGYAYDDLTAPHLAELRATMQRVAREQGDRFPEWALDRMGTEVMLANRIVLGPGQAPPRFRWVSFDDALMLPLDTRAERVTPDRRVLYPLEERLLHRYLADLGVARLPPTLDAYVRTVVTPTLERQRQAGAVAVKFEAAYLRALDFDEPDVARAQRVYARYVARGRPPHAEYKALQDYLFRVIAREAGRLGMAVHIHAFEGGGGFYQVRGSDPLLLEPALNDSTLRGTTFVIVHGGGGPFARHTLAMFWKPNVYADFSVSTLTMSATTLAGVLREWLAQYPERVLFGTDASVSGPDLGWDVVGWLSARTGRQALTMALTGMMRDGEITRSRAEEIATMVMRTNAARLYNLTLR
jgi:hypothetical protein